MRKDHWINAGLRERELKKLWSQQREEMKRKLLEEVLENISRRQFIEHCRGTCWTRRRLLRIFELFRWRRDFHFCRGIFASIRNGSGISHGVLQRIRRWTVATRNQIDDVLIGSRQSSDCWFLLGCWLFRALKILGHAILRNSIFVLWNFNGNFESFKQKFE